MTIRIPHGKSALLLVEGREDKEFFIQLGSRVTSTADWPIHIDQYGGATELADYLYALTRLPGISRLRCIGIVRDADFATDAFSSVQSAIENANSDSCPNPIPVPATALEITEGAPGVVIMLMPSADREGMLEDLVMDAFNADPVTTCVDAYFQCLGDSGIAVLPNRRSKARLRAFVTGKNVSEEATGADADRLYLSDVFHMSWWRDEFWDNPGFDDSKSFLNQLLTG